MGKEATRAQSARDRARQKRIEMQAGRAAEDKAIEDHTAAVFTALEARAAAERAAVEADSQAGAAVRALLQIKNMTQDEVAALTELTKAEVSRYARAESRAGASTGEVPRTKPANVTAPTTATVGKPTATVGTPSSDYAAVG